MAPIVSKVKSGFNKIAGDGLFPANSRVGLMTTSDKSIASRSFILDNELTKNSCNDIYADNVVSDSEAQQFVDKYHNISDLAKVKGDLKTICNSFRTGYYELVDKESIALSERKDKSDFPGCDAWFAPTQKDSKGNFCLDSAANISLESNQIEAGISALDGFIKNGKDKFREESLVNVIFVSDAHDPGVNYFDSIKNSISAETARYTDSRLSVDLSKLTPEKILEHKKIFENIITVANSIISSSKDKDVLARAEQRIEEAKKNIETCDVYYKSQTETGLSLFNKIESETGVKVKNIKFHGLTPQMVDNCSEVGEKIHIGINNGYTYDRLIKETSGTQLGFCSDADAYVQFISKMIDESLKSDIRIPLPEKLDGEIEKIEIAGEQIEFSIEKETNTIRINNINVYGLQLNGVKEYEVNIFQRNPEYKEDEVKAPAEDESNVEVN